MNFQQFTAQHGVSLEFNKHDHVFNQGDEDEFLYFVKSGLLKAYYLSKEGKESIKSFIRPGSTISSLSSSYRSGPCSFSLIALQHARVVQLPFKKLVQASGRSHDLAKIVIEQLLNLSMKKELREYEFLTLPAEERYRRLCHTDPELVKQVTQNDLARYLGITPVALSRIKNRVGL